MDKKPHPIDMHVGGRIRMRRNMLGISQVKLGQRLGITFQQVQKYEKGTNRVGASRLQDIASALDTSAPFFFEGAPARETLVASANADEQGNPMLMEFCSSPEGLALNRAFGKIASAKIRRRIVQLVCAVASAGQEDGTTSESGRIIGQ